MAKLVAFSCVLVFLLLGSIESKGKGRVIGGKPVKPGQYPFLVSIRYNGQHFCGGSIISKDVILTAAHCLEDKSPIFTRHISVLAGTHSLDSGGVEITASRFTYHRGYTTEEDDYDIGLIVLSSPLTYSATIQPAELPSEDEDYHESEDNVVVAGWGDVSEGSATPSIARYVNIPLWSRKVCLRYLPDLTWNMLCGGSFDGQKNSCPGDSGGPLIKGNNKVIGTVSYGFGCGTPNAPAIYASVSNLRSWITLNANV